MQVELLEKSTGYNHHFPSREVPPNAVCLTKTEWHECRQVVRIFFVGARGQPSLGNKLLGRRSEIMWVPMDGVRRYIYLGTFWNEAMCDDMSYIVLKEKHYNVPSTKYSSTAATRNFPRPVSKRRREKPQRFVSAQNGESTSWPIRCRIMFLHARSQVRHPRMFR